MPTQVKHRSSKSKDWPKQIKFGRETVKVYRRQMPNGDWGFMVANYSSGKRKFDSYSTEAKAIDAANLLARRLSTKQVVAANMTNSEAASYAAAVETLKPHEVSLPVAAETLSECIRVAGSLPTVLEAVKFWAQRNKPVTRATVSEVVEKLLEVKRKAQSSKRNLQDLKNRLGKFAADFQKDCCDVSTSEIQNWLDELDLSNRSKINYRRTIHTLFAFAEKRGFAADNPATATEVGKADEVSVEIYTPAEIQKLLKASSSEFLPVIVLGAFAGLRSAEIERLNWEDLSFDESHIVIGKDKAKTASRRVVPIWDNCAEWLAQYQNFTGDIWRGDESKFHKTQRSIAESAGVAWKSNALRHSYASYRFAQTSDAGRVAGELGNTADVVHKHYRALVSAKEAEKWFSIRPDSALKNVIKLNNAS